MTVGLLWTFAEFPIGVVLTHPTNINKLYNKHILNNT